MAGVGGVGNTPSTYAAYQKLPTADTSASQAPAAPPPDDASAASASASTEDNSVVAEQQDQADLDRSAADPDATDTIRDSEAQRPGSLPAAPFGPSTRGRSAPSVGTNDPTVAGGGRTMLAPVRQAGMRHCIRHSFGRLGTCSRKKRVKRRADMGDLVRQLECLSCSNKRSFLQQTPAGPRNISQTEVAALPKHAVVACGRCGGTNLIVCWDDGYPYRAPDTIQRRRRRSVVPAGAPAIKVTRSEARVSEAHVS